MVPIAKYLVFYAANRFWCLKLPWFEPGAYPCQPPSTAFAVWGFCGHPKEDGGQMCMHNLKFSVASPPNKFSGSIWKNAPTHQSVPQIHGPFQIVLSLTLPSRSLFLNFNRRINYIQNPPIVWGCITYHS